MQRSPVNNKQAVYGSAPDVSNPVENLGSDTVTLRSSKRRRCDCGTNYESKLDIFIDSLTEWKQTTDDKLNSIQTSMSDIQRLNAEIVASNIEIEKSITLLSVKYENVCEQLSSIQIRTEECLDRVSKSELVAEEIDRSSRSACLELRNIPHKSNSSQEDLVKIVVTTFKALSIEIFPINIFDVRHLPSKSVNKTIVVSLNSVLTKNKILRAFKSFNKSNAGNRLNSGIFDSASTSQPIYIAEHLTPRARRLHYLAREFAKEEQYKHCWTSGGRVLLRKYDDSKYLVVTSEDQLLALKQKC